MGGNAFKNLLPNASFPRMPPPVYTALKARLSPILQELYAHVTVSPECPGKPDYGDLDFVATGPRHGLTLTEVKHALRATCSVPMEGSRTSNYAVPFGAFEEVVRAARDGTPDGALASWDSDGQTFFQVDVNVCADRAQLDRTVLFTSYGDLGFFLGLLAQTAGLSFNIFGLKLAEPVRSSTSQTFYLSSSMPDILAFFGLSMARWERGFATQEEIFQWLATSPFVRPLVARLRSMEERVEARPMRQNFFAFLRAMDLDAGDAAAAAPSGAQSEVESIFADPWGDRQEKIDAALRHFSKYEEHAALLYLGRASARAREVLNGTNVQNWTGVQGMPVRFVMDEVKARLETSQPAHDQGVGPEAAGVPGWQHALLAMSEEEVRALVVTVKEELQKDGRLEFDWRTAKAAKLERRQKKESENGSEQNNEVLVAVA